MTYKQAITDEMTLLGEREDVVFLGEGIINAGRVYGTLDDVPLNKCIEMPIMENTIVSVAIGLALEGYLPVVVFQRMDFMLCAADAIINHLGMMAEYSNGLANPKVIIRAIVGDPSTKFDCGIQHTGDYTDMFHMLITTTVVENPQREYNFAHTINDPSIMIEYKGRYEDEIN